MVLVFLLGTVLFVLFIITVFIIFSTIRIKIENWEVRNSKKKKNEKKHQITTTIHLFNKLKWISLRIDNKKMQKIFVKLHLDNLDIKKLEKDFQISDIKEIIEIRPKISQLDLQIKLGLEDVILTTYTIPILATVISFILATSVKRENMNKIKYNVEPIYDNKNLYKIKLNTILEIKLLNLLNSSFKIYVSRRQKGNKLTKNANKIKTNV